MCHDDAGLNCHARIRAANCLLDQQSLCACKLAAPCTESDLCNHRENVTLDILQGKLSASATARKREADSPRGKNAWPPVRDDSILARLNQQIQRLDRQ